MTQATGELIALIPDWEDLPLIPSFIGQCLNYGIDFYFEDGDRLPDKVPADVKGVRVVVLEQNSYEENKDVLKAYADRGVHIHIFSNNSDSGPQLVTPWENNNVFHQMVFQCGLTVDAPSFRQKMLARGEEEIFDSLQHRMLRYTENRWYDTTRYIWEGWVDGYEVTGDTSYLDTLRDRIHDAIANQPNILDNCDCVSPFSPMLRLYHIETDESDRRKLLEYCRSHMDRYLEVTPRYKGVLANFQTFRLQARSEIALHVCPALIHLGNITGEQSYIDIALDQFDRLHELLFEEQMGLWRHGASERYVTAAFWGRGVAFGLLAWLQILELLDPKHPLYDYYLQIFQSMARRVREFQDVSGFWFQVVDDPKGEKESSGTAWNVAAFERGMRLGVLDATYRTAADAGWEAIKTRVWSGHYPGHATGTTASPVYNYFSQRPLSPTGWSHFAFLAACERRRNARGL